MINAQPTKCKCGCPLVAGIETWKTVEEIPAYEVSDHGRVRRVLPARGINTVGHVRKSHQIYSGYIVFKLCHNGREYNRFAHRLVLLAFGGPPPADKQECDHIDGDRTNNHISNLRWTGRLENVRGAISRRGGRHWAAGEGGKHVKLNESQVRLTRALRAIGAGDGWQSALARAWGVHAASISRTCRGEWWSYLDKEKA